MKKIILLLLLITFGAFAQDNVTLLVAVAKKSADFGANTANTKQTLN